MNMEKKTKVQAGEDEQTIIVTREFNLPVELLFDAYVIPEVIEEWMGTKVIKLETRRHGSYEFETTDPRGNKHRFNGVIHECVTGVKITRTFEMENTSFPVQLEFLEFQGLTSETSKLTMTMIYRSVADRDQMLKLPFAQGVNMAHNRLEEIQQKKISDYEKKR
jgi:uncharacterized protein YndB with AHSA1/START domain